MFFKKDVLKNSAIFTGNLICWSLFLITLRNSSEQVFHKASLVAAYAHPTQSSQASLFGRSNLPC